MPDSPQLYLVTPRLADPAQALPGLAAALGHPDVVAVLLWLEVADERTLVNRIKAVATAAHRADAALIVSGDGPAAATVAVRGGADGLHVVGSGLVRASRDALPADRSLGVGGLRTRDDAMAAGEAGADYLMFGEPRPDGFVPPLADTAERTAWWAEIFETPCVTYAGTADAAATLGRTGAEFVALGEWAWDGPDGAAPFARLAASLRVVPA